MIQLTPEQLNLVAAITQETKKLVELQLHASLNELRSDVAEIKIALNGNKELGTTGMQHAIIHQNNELEKFKEETKIQMQLMRKRLSSVSNKNNILAAVLTFFTIGIGWVANIIYQWAKDKLTQQNNIPPIIN